MTATEVSPEVVTPSTEAPSARAPSKPKKASKPAKAPKTAKGKKSPGKAPKSTKKASKPKATGTRPAKDDARLVAKASDGKLNPAQVRILRALRDSKAPKGHATRDDIKEAVGIGREGKYSKSWLDSLWALASGKHKYIDIHDPVEGERAYYHSITSAGKEVLKASEAAAKKEAKAA